MYMSVVYNALHLVFLPCVVSIEEFFLTQFILYMRYTS